MGLTWLLATFFAPLLGSLFIIHAVVTGEHLDSWHVWLVENLILLVKEFHSLFSCLVLINASLCFVKESLLFDNEVMLFNYICVSSGKSLIIRKLEVLK